MSNAKVDDFSLNIFATKNNEIDYCEQYPYKNLTEQVQCSEGDFDHTLETIRCDPKIENIELIFEPFAMDTTFATEFKLVCSYQYQVMQVGFFYFVQFRFIINTPPFKVL